MSKSTEITDPSIIPPGGPPPPPPPDAAPSEDDIPTPLPPERTPSRISFPDDPRKPGGPQVEVEVLGDRPGWRGRGLAPKNPSAVMRNGILDLR